MFRTLTRREFIAASSATLLTAASYLPAADAPAKIKLGFDNFSVRGNKWNARQLLDYAASLKMDTILLSDLDVYESLDEPYLKKIKEQADRLGIVIYAGTGSVCPTAKWFNNKRGTAEENLALTLRVGKLLGSPAIRCVLGSREDRRGDGGIEPHIEAMVKVCRAARNQVLDSGVKIAVENHAGDMQAWELVQLIEGAGKDCVGACMDAGNAAWTLEDPIASLEILGPFALMTGGIRDSAVWESENGAKVQWTAMGDGSVDWNSYMKKFTEICPTLPIQLEIISGGAQEFRYLDPDFWSVYPKARSKDFARFLAWAKRGKPAAEDQKSDPAATTEPTTPEGREQMWQLERSVKFCRETLKLGTKS